MFDNKIFLNSVHCYSWLYEQLASSRNLLSYGTKYSRMNQVKFVKDSLSKIWSEFPLGHVLEYFVQYVDNPCSVLQRKDFIEIKGALSSLRKFLRTESPLKMMKNAFYFTLKARLVLKIFKFLSWIFGHVEKRLDWRDKVNFKIYDVTTWLTNTFNTNIDQYLKK